MAEPLRPPESKRDAEDIARLLDELGYPATGDQVTVRLDRLAQDDDYVVLVADDQGGVVGLVAAHFLKTLEHDDRWCQVIALVVSSKHRRRGVGAGLLAAVEAESRLRGCAGMLLGSANRRDDAHAFYEALGFRSTGRRFTKPLR
jgi:GNAT superfamily N-acetyltransferase